jgi:uncharacterized membrane protein YeaQ/YmgE (transglycosylase-associated protein family)
LTGSANSATYITGLTAANVQGVIGSVSTASFPTLNQNTTGSANNASYLNGVIGSGYALLSGATFTGQIIGYHTGAIGANTPNTGAFTTVTAGTIGNSGATLYGTLNSSSASQTNITGLGNITAGTWSATTVGLAYGGTGSTSAQTAMNTLAGATTSAQYLRGNGTNVVMSAIQASDVPTLNQNTTGSANNASYLGGTAAAGYALLSGATFSGAVIPNANNSVNLGSASAWWATIYGKSNQALYADLAENYKSDFKYQPGTVVVFGGTEEITISKKSYDTRIAGIVSTEPAYLMNSSLDEMMIAVALTGRVPCNVMGPVAKGDLLVSSDIEGIAQKLEPTKWSPGCVIGKSLEDHNQSLIKTIEVVTGRF